MLRQIEGSRAVAEAVAMCRPEVICAYPISPQTHIVEGLGELVKSGALAPCEFINVESEFAAMSVAIGSSAAGARTYTATASQGLLFMVEAVYSYPYQNHAPMEPMNTTALYTADRCEVWTPTQNGEAALASAAHTLGIPPQNVIVHKTMLGGGFGRRLETDMVAQAVAIAAASGGKADPKSVTSLLRSRAGLA